MREAQRAERWWRALAAAATALALGLGQAHADIRTVHDGGQGRDKETGAFARAAFAEADRSAGEVRALAAVKATVSNMRARDEEPEPVGLATVLERVERSVEPEATATVTVENDEGGTGTTTRTRTTTRNFEKNGYVVSRTRSRTVTVDEDGNRAVARSVARARAPDDVEAVENGAGSVVAKTSVAVEGNGAASAEAGGSVGVNDGEVEVATWGRTTAEVH